MIYDYSEQIAAIFVLALTYLLFLGYLGLRFLLTHVITEPEVVEKKEQELQKVLCPVCHADLAQDLDKAYTKSRLGSSYVIKVECPCGSVGTWDFLGYPFVLLEYTNPVELMDESIKKELDLNTSVKKSEAELESVISQINLKIKNTDS